MELNGPFTPGQLYFRETPVPTEQLVLVGTGTIWKFLRIEKSPSTVRIPNRASFTSVDIITTISRLPQMVGWHKILKAVK
jgi:hypothetical protein